MTSETKEKRPVGRPKKKPIIVPVFTNDADIRKFLTELTLQYNFANV